MSRYHLPIHCPHCNTEFTSSNWQPRVPFMNQIALIPYLDSKLGYQVMDMDAFIRLSGSKHIICEFKLYNGKVTRTETECLSVLSASLCLRPEFNGAYLFQYNWDGDVNDKAMIYEMVNGLWQSVGNNTSDGHSLVFHYDDIFRFVERRTSEQTTISPEVV